MCLSVSLSLSLSLSLTLFLPHTHTHARARAHTLSVSLSLSLSLWSHWLMTFFKPDQGGVSLHLPGNTFTPFAHRLSPFGNIFQNVVITCWCDGGLSSWNRITKFKSLTVYTFYSSNGMWTFEYKTMDTNWPSYTNNKMNNPIRVFGSNSITPLAPAAFAGTQNMTKDDPAFQNYIAWHPRHAQATHEHCEWPKSYQRVIKNNTGPNKRSCNGDCAIIIRYVWNILHQRVKMEFAIILIICTLFSNVIKKYKVHKLICGAIEWWT